MMALFDTVRGRDTVCSKKSRCGMVGSEVIFSGSVVNGMVVTEFETSC